MENQMTEDNTFATSPQLYSKVTAGPWTKSSRMSCESELLNWPSKIGGLETEAFPFMLHFSAQVLLMHEFAHDPGLHG